MMRIDLYEDEAGALCLHREGESYIFAITTKTVADLVETLTGVPGANVFEALAVEVSVLSDGGSSWLDRVERLPLEHIGSTAQVATYTESGVQLHNGAAPGTAPPRPNARRVLRDLGET